MWKKKVTTKPQDELIVSPCESQTKFHSSLKKVELFSKEYFQLVNRCQIEGKIPINGLHQLSSNGQKEYVELVESYTGSKPSSKTFIFSNPSTNVSCSNRGRECITAIDLVSLHGSVELLKEMLAINNKDVDNIKLPRGNDHVVMEKIIEIFSYSSDKKFGNYLLQKLIRFQHYSLLERFLDEHGNLFSGKHCSPSSHSMILDPVVCFGSVTNVAADRRDYQALEILINHGFVVTRGNSPLELAAKDGDCQRIESLLENAVFVTSEWVNRALEIAREQKESVSFSFIRTIMSAFTSVPSDDDLARTFTLLEEKKKLL